MKRTIIKTSQSLVSLGSHAAEAGCVAIDTEFVWERTYYPTLGIVQVASSKEEAFIIDMLAIEDFTPLGNILSDKKIVKILHDAQQDLTILHRATGAYPQNIFDTRLAAGFAGLSSTVSLSALLNELLGLKLAKTETRSDWLKRPLTSKQLDYALDDVRYLPATRDELLSRTEKLGHSSWLEEELAKYDNPALYEWNNPNEQFLRVKGVNRLAPRNKSVLRELALWREEMAIKKNCPRSWVISDQTLINLARQRPQVVPELETIEGLTEEMIYQYGPKMMEAIIKGCDSSDKEKPESTEPAIANKEYFNAQVDLVLAYMKGKSMAEGIDPALVATRAEITSIVQENALALPENHRILRGWRREFLGEELLQLVAGKLAVRLDNETGLPVRDRETK